jgi:methylenetetrahydrofolate dehydrogenase (NADP+)/methenyltetrahydrofolate cyclohydrolase
MVIDGKKIASEIISKLEMEPRPDKFLAAVLVGADASSISFLKRKEKTAGEVRVEFRLYKFDEKTTQNDLEIGVLKIISDGNCGGIIVQLPLPKHIDSQNILNLIPKEKDVDVLGDSALGAFYTGEGVILPPAVRVVEEIVRNLNLEIKNCCVAVIGLGPLVGKPIATWLTRKTRDLYLLRRGSNFDVLKNCDLIISGAGKNGLFSAEYLRVGATVIDFGYSTINGKISGDFNPLDAEKIYYTPTPGGTGPVLVAKLLENFFVLNSKTP